MKKKLPIGLSDFKRMIEEDYYYVDKSLFIKDILDSGSTVILLPRPRRFGKTLNLSMLRYFYEKTKVNKSYLFKNLNIWKAGELYKNKQGKYPVIFLTFKDIKNDKWEIALNKIKILIGDEYLRHKYLLEQDILEEREKDIYRQIMNLNADSSFYEDSIRILSNYLEKYHGEKAVILIDEYDAPIQSGYVYKYYNEVINFMRNLLSGAFKDNSSLEKGVLTGILRIAKESIFSGLNNLEVCTLLREKYSTYFGLLENEVEEMLKFYGIECEMDDVRDWYNGYLFGEDTVYNPWSIVNYTDSWRDGLRPHWVNTSSNEIVRQIITRSGKEVKEDLEKLITGQCITKIVDDNIIFGEIEKDSNSIWSFLLFSGYLKLISKEIKNKRLYCDLEIPNAEVEYLYEKIIMEWFDRSIYNDKLNMMLKSLTAGDIKTFGKIFREFVVKTFSYFDTGGSESEKVYHAFVLGLLVHLNENYEIKSNRESGYGRYDVMVIPKDTSKTGIVFEFKKVDKYENEDLAKAAQAALGQIEEKNYRQELLHRGIRNIIEIGIAFEGKDVLIKEVYINTPSAKSSNSLE